MVEGKFELLYTDFGRALASFKIGLEEDLSIFTAVQKDLMVNGQIQKFEISIELTWKIIKAYFAEKRDKKYNFPKENVKVFMEEEFIDEETYRILIDALTSRNLLSHIYKEEYFVEIEPKLKSYATAIEAVYNSFQL